jgi:hypothetical protein
VSDHEFKKAYRDVLTDPMRVWDQWEYVLWAREYGQREAGDERSRILLESLQSLQAEIEAVAARMKTWDAEECVPSFHVIDWADRLVSIARGETT